MNCSTIEVQSHLNSLPNNKILDQSKLKDLADDKINFNPKTELYFGKSKKHCGKRRTLS